MKFRAGEVKATPEHLIKGRAKGLPEGKTEKRSIRREDPGTGGEGRIF